MYEESVRDVRCGGVWWCGVCRLRDMYRMYVLWFDSYDL